MKNIKALSVFVMVCTFCFLAGTLCGCGIKYPAYIVVANHLPPIESGYARVYLYSYEAIAVNPLTVRIDGSIVGYLKGYECLFVDRPAGPCKITVSSQRFCRATDLMLDLTTGETQYVMVGSSIFSYDCGCLTRTDPKVATQDMEDCWYVGVPVPDVPKD